MDYWFSARSAVYAVCYSNDTKGAKNHVSNCYFFLTNVLSHSSKSKRPIEYPNLSSALRPLPHVDSLSVGLPNSRAVLTIGDVGETVTKEIEDCIDPDFQSLQCRESHLITQRELKFNDLVRD